MERTRRSTRIAAALICCAALSGCGSDLDDGEYVWPIGGTGELPPMSSSFGPRLQLSRDARYDFHRGIDIPTFVGTPVYAVAAGKVRRAGRDPAFSDIAVQIEHCKDDGGCLYSTYIHLALPVVDAGDQVERGQHIGYTGVASGSLFPHLHFEIREGQPEQDHCVHPLRYLPTPSWIPPALSLLSINDATLSSVSVEVEVTLPSVSPGLLRVAVQTRSRSSGEVLEEKVFDYDEWNREHTSEDNPRSIDDPTLGGIRIEPAKFNLETPVYAMRFRFSGLTGPASAGDLLVTARAEDVNGNATEVRSR